MAEPDITGGFGGNKPTSMGASVNFQVPGLSETSKTIAGLDKSLQGLQNTLKSFQQQQGMLSSGVRNVMDGVRTGAQSAATTVNMANFSATGSLGGGGMGMTPTGIPYATGGGGGDTFTGSINSSLNAYNGGDTGVSALAKLLVNVTNLPINYGYNRIEENRANAVGIAQALGPTARMRGEGIGSLISSLDKGTPVMGGINDVLNAMSVGTATGYGDLRSGRSGNYFQSIREMQTLTPGVGAGQIASQFSSFLGNTQGHQRSMMLTGGAMSGFGAGGAPKTLSEWAEGILKMFQSLRPGKDRGKEFTKEELQTQMFPGSNMDAWFSVNAVPDYMREYFWQYVIGKAHLTTGGTGSIVDQISAMGGAGGDLALQRLKLNTATSRREFALASGSGLGTSMDTTMYEQYIKREQVDTKFMDALRYLDKILGNLAGTFGGGIAGMPTAVANIGYNVITKTMPDIAAAASGLIPFGIGDPGGYGAYGGTGTAHMDPSFARRLSAMMDANPNLQINSGFRDGGLQGKLYANGVGMTAPAGQSMHGRGLAADLGPSSEFGWIAANAERFGLSGASHLGEPWHVGMPGTVPIGDSSGLWGGLQETGRVYGVSRTLYPGGLSSASSFPGAGPAAGGAWDVAQGMGGGGGITLPPMSATGTLSGGGGIWEGIVKALLGPLEPLFTKGLSAGASALSGDLSGVMGMAKGLGSQAFEGLFKLMGLPDIFNPLKWSEGNVDIGQALAFLSGSNVQGGRIGARFESAGSGGGGGGGGSWGGGSGTFPASVANIMNQYNLPSATAANVSGREGAIAAALQAAKSVGFGGDQLVMMGAIAGKESGWDPRKHYQASRDDSYGLWQINMLGNLGPQRRAQYGLANNDALYDPMTNAKAAWGISSRGTNFGPWGTSTAGERAKIAQYVEPVYNVAKQFGFIGDPRRGGAMMAPVSNNYAPTSLTNVSSSPVTIHNNFNIQSTGGNVDGVRLASVVSDRLMDQLTDTTSRGR